MSSKMSWDSFIDSMIAYSRDMYGNLHIDKACIIGKDGGMWTTECHAANFKLSQAECTNISRNIRAGELGHNLYNGIFLAGEKYQYLRFDTETQTVLGKRIGNGAVTIQPSKSAIVIGHCPEGGQHGLCNNAVSKIVEHLVASGY